MSDDRKPAITYVDITDVGMRRANNQDSYLSVPAENRERFNSRGHLFVVADGMGAHAAGELASKMATEAISLNYFRDTNPDAVAALRDAVVQANKEIYTRGQQNPEFHNMGTTASTLAILPQGAVIAHVGDSRVYRLRRGVFEQLTFDHSLVWEMEASGQVSPDSALGQAIPKNVITRSLGPNGEVVVDIEGPIKVEKGDQFLLCSDGLSGLVDDTEIGTLLDCLPEDLAAKVLVDLTNLRGGPDNTTVIIVTVQEGADASVEAARPKAKAQSMMPAVLGGLTILALVLAAGLAYMSNWGLAIVLAVSGVISAVFFGFEVSKQQKEESAKPLPKVSGGKGPYRRFAAKADQSLFNKLGETVQALRDAASNHNWLMEWTKIDALQKKGVAALRESDPKQAIRLQAEAIIQTMQQLREQHNRAADETAIDY